MRNLRKVYLIELIFCVFSIATLYYSYLNGFFEPALWSLVFGFVLLGFIESKIRKPLEATHKSVLDDVRRKESNLFMGIGLPICIFLIFLDKFLGDDVLKQNPFLAYSHKMPYYVYFFSAAVTSITSYIQVGKILRNEKLEE